MCNERHISLQQRDQDRPSTGAASGHSEALSDGVRCGLSSVALELALCVVELAIVLLPRSGRLKPRFRGSLAKAVSLKRSVKIAAVEDSELR
ncbi:hypothetical protein F2Q69_00063853 [Brassica cretica]|uniref:Uncharacterized protein n=1 Tax=Brassica cretica TaxID=69181 RepID=A0A8S9REM6_BRACR|nr:hypothetical protein F2Q69_00063853 [Brassica cretica]